MDHTKNTVDIFNKLAESYQDKFMDVSMYQNSLSIYCNALEKENPKILEVACGPGNITKYLNQKRPDFKITGTDLAPNMITLAKKNNPSSTFKLMDCREIHSLNKRFDGIVCGFGLPYLNKDEAIQFIKDSSRQLNINGLIYISTIENDNSKSGFITGSTGDQIFQNFHHEDYLKMTLEDNRFNVIHVERIEYIHNNEKTTDLILIAKKY